MLHCMCIMSSGYTVHIRLNIIEVPVCLLYVYHRVQMHGQLGTIHELLS